MNVSNSQTAISLCLVSIFFSRLVRHASMHDSTKSGQTMKAQTMKANNTNKETEAFLLLSKFLPISSIIQTGNTAGYYTSPRTKPK